MHNTLKFAINVIRAFQEGKPPTGTFYAGRIDGVIDSMNEIAEKYEAVHNEVSLRLTKRENIGEIIIISDDVAIAEIHRAGEFFGYFPVVKGRVSSTYSKDKEIAIFIALAEKHEGLNSQFSFYASKMLGIEEPK